MKKMGYPDRPVASITEDLFNVEVYVNALCCFIRSCESRQQQVEGVEIQALRIIRLNLHLEEVI